MSRAPLRSLIALASVTSLVSLVSVVALSSLPRVAFGQTYTITAIRPEHGEAQAFAINEAGQVAGTQFGIGEDGFSRGFRWQAGVFTWMTSAQSETATSAFAISADGSLAGWARNEGSSLRAVRRGSSILQDLGVSSIGARGINDKGLAVGTLMLTEERERAFLLDRSGEIVPLGTLGGTMSRGLGINNDGLVVGDAMIEGDAAMHAFKLDDDDLTMVDLGVLKGGVHSHAYAVNDAGVAAGASEDEGGRLYPALFENGQVRKIGERPGRALDVNKHGDVVGSWEGIEAFLFRGGAAVPLASLVAGAEGWTLREARGINDAGQIVGWGYHGDTMMGFLLQPKGGDVAPAAVPGGTLRFRAQPSVTSGKSYLAFGMPLAGPSKVTLFSVAGRRLRGLEAPLGADGVEWDGRDDGGRQVASGIVLARLEGPGVEAVTRITIIR